MATCVTTSTVTPSSADTDRINFFRVCRIILDDCPNTLRDFFRHVVRSKYGHAWSDNSTSGNWFWHNERWQSKLSREQIKMIQNGDTYQWDPTLLFHAFLHSSLCLLADNVHGVQATLQPGSNIVTLSAKLPVNTISRRDLVMFDLGNEMFRSEVINIQQNQLTIKDKFSPSSKLRVHPQQGAKADMFVCQRTWYAVQKLSFIRNDNFAHCNAASTSAIQLKHLIQNVEAIYKDLGAQQRVISDMKAIETEEIASACIVGRIKVYQERWQLEAQNYKVVHERITFVEGTIEVLRSDVTTVKEKDIPVLNDAVGRIEKDQVETSKETNTLKDEQKTLLKKVEVSSERTQLLESDVKSIEDTVQTNHRQLKAVESTVTTLQTQQTNTATRVSCNIELTKQLLSNQKFDKKEIDRTFKDHTEIIQRNTSAVEQIALKQDKTGKDVAVLNTTVVEIKSDVQLIKEDVQLIRQESKNADTDILRKLNPSHFESDIQYYSEKFHAGTRQWLFDQIDKWRNGIPTKCQPKICIITGNPGMGKSVIAAKLCSMEKEKGFLAGCFFFQHQQMKRSTPRMLVQTLVHQFCSSIPEYQSLVKKILIDINLSEMSCSELFTSLVLEPLHQLSPAELSSSKLIIIDALDECEFESYSELVKLINREFIKLPKCFSVILTTRPDQKFTQQLRKIRPVFELIPSDPQNIKDITLFLSDVLKGKINPEEYEVGLNLLVKKSEGMFLYFHYAIDTLIEQEHLTLEVLESLLPDGIDDYYDQNFQRIYKSLGHEKYHLLLQAVVAAKTDLPQEMVAPLLCISAEESGGITEAVSVLLPVCNKHFHMFHKSIRDWLVDKELAGDLMVNPTLGHKYVGTLCLSIIHDIKSNRSTLAELSNSPINQYAINNVVYHLCNMTADKSVAEKLLSSLSDLQYIYYRLLLSKGTIGYLLDDYTEAKRHLSHTDFVDYRQQIEHCSNFVKRYAQQVCVMPHLIFQLALNESNLSLDCLKVQQYLPNPKSFFPDLNVFLEVTNKSVLVDTTITNYACKDDVTFCIQNLDEKVIICSDSGGKLYVWEKESNELLHTENAEHYSYIQPVSALSMSPDGKCVVFGDVKESLSLEGNLIPLIPSSNVETNACAFSPDNTKLLSWTYYGDNIFKFTAEIDLVIQPLFIVELWDLKTFKCKRLERATKNCRPHFACFSHDGQYILCGHRDGRILKWDSVTGMMIAVIYTDGKVTKKQGDLPLSYGELDREDHVSHIACSPNGYYFAACSRNGVLLWDAVSLTLLQTLVLEHAVCGRRARFLHCSFSADSTHIVAGSNDGFLKVWKRESHSQQLFKTDIYTTCKLDDVAASIVSPFFDKHMNVICGTGNAVFVHSYTKLQRASELHQKEKPVFHPGCARSSSFLSTLERALTCGYDTLYVWDVPTGLIACSATGVRGHLIRLSNDGNFLLTYGDEAYIQVWDTRTLSCISTLSCQNQKNVVAGPRGPDESSPNDICHCAVSNTGMVIGGTGNGLLYLLYGEKYRSRQLLKGHQSLITWCEFLPDSSQVLSADMDGDITLWQLVHTGGTLEVNKVKLKSHRDTVEQVYFLPSFQAHRIVSCSCDGDIQLYHAPSGDFIKVMKGHTGAVLKMVISPDGNTIASGGDNGQVIVWDGTTGEMKKKIPCIGGMISDLQFVCGGDLICTLEQHQDSCAGSIIRTYDTKSGSYVSCLMFPTKILSMATSKYPQQNWLLCCLADENIKFVKVHSLKCD